MRYDVHIVVLVGLLMILSAPLGGMLSNIEGLGSSVTQKSVTGGLNARDTAQNPVSIYPYQRLTTTPDLNEVISAIDGNYALVYAYELGYTTLGVMDVNTGHIDYISNGGAYLSGWTLHGNRTYFSGGPETAIYYYDMGADGVMNSSDDTGVHKLCNLGDANYTSGGLASNIAADDNTVVWVDYMDTNSDWYYERVVFSYDLNTHTKTRLSNYSSEATSVMVDGDYVVWSTIYDVYLHYLGNGTTVKLTGAGMQGRAVISGHWVAWIDWETNMGVVVYDIDTGKYYRPSIGNGFDYIFYVELDGDNMVGLMEGGKMFYLNLQSWLWTPLTPPYGLGYDSSEGPYISGSTVIWSAYPRMDPTYTLKSDIFKWDMSQGYIGVGSDVAAVVAGNNIKIFDRSTGEWHEYSSDENLVGRVSVMNGYVLYRTSSQLFYYDPSIGDAVPTVIGAGDMPLISDNLTALLSSGHITYYVPSSHSWATESATGTPGDYYLTPYYMAIKYSSWKLYSIPLEQWDSPSASGLSFTYPYIAYYSSGGSVYAWDALHNSWASTIADGTPDGYGMFLTVKGSGHTAIYSAWRNAWYTVNENNTVNSRGKTVAVWGDSGVYIYFSGSNVWCNTSASDSVAVGEDIVVVKGTSSTVAYTPGHPAGVSTAFTGGTFGVIGKVGYVASGGTVNTIRAGDDAWGSKEFGSGGYVVNYDPFLIYKSSTSIAAYNVISGTWAEQSVSGAGDVLSTYSGDSIIGINTSSGAYVYAQGWDNWVSIPHTGVLITSGDIMCVVADDGQTYAVDSSGTIDHTSTTGDVIPGRGFIWMEGSTVKYFSTSEHAWTDLGSGKALSSGSILLHIGSATTAVFSPPSSAPPVSNDTDGDGMPDDWEVNNGLDPTADDSTGDADGDGVSNLDEYKFGTDPGDSTSKPSEDQVKDTDGDGMPDVWEGEHGLDPNVNDASQDSDGDGLTNLDEYKEGTNPTSSDTDGDGMPDGWEVTEGLDPTVNDAADDTDGDGLTNLEEYTSSTSPEDSDTDDDVMPDGWEVKNGLDPTANDANGDVDGDGATNVEEFQHDTNPNNPDTDADGMPDGWEIHEGLNPTANDAEEDADGDGAVNIEEYEFDTSPKEPSSKPAVDTSNPYILVRLDCPADMLITAPTGDMLGYQSGVLKTDFGQQVKDDGETEIYFIGNNSDDILYKVTGTGSGVYNLTITSYDGTTRTSVIATGLSIGKDQSDLYKVEWAKVKAKDPTAVSVKLDSDGDGTYDREFSSDGIITQAEKSAATPIGGTGGDNTGGNGDNTGTGGDSEQKGGVSTTTLLIGGVVLLLLIIVVIVIATRKKGPKQEYQSQQPQAVPPPPPGGTEELPPPPPPESDDVPPPPSGSDELPPPPPPESDDVPPPPSEDDELPPPPPPESDDVPPPPPPPPPEE